MISYKLAKNSGSTTKIWLFRHTLTVWLAVYQTCTYLKTAPTPTLTSLLTQTTYIHKFNAA